MANIPDLKYCSAFGDTEEEALHEVIIARNLWLSAFEGEGNEAPEAKFDPQLIGATK